jgi:hypothetical protein
MASGNEDHFREDGERSNTKLYPGRQGEKGEIEKMSENAARLRHLSNQTDRSSGWGGGEDEEEVSAEPEATANASRGRTRKQQERNKEVM